MSLMNLTWGFVQEKRFRIYTKLAEKDCESVFRTINSGSS